MSSDLTAKGAAANSRGACEHKDIWGLFGAQHDFAHLVDGSVNKVAATVDLMPRHVAERAGDQRPANVTGNLSRAFTYRANPIVPHPDR